MIFSGIFSFKMQFTNELLESDSPKNMDALESVTGVFADFQSYFNKEQDLREVCRGHLSFSLCFIQFSIVKYT